MPDLSATLNTVPSIGVVIPTYNRWDRLLICLQHLERQTCKDFEVVVVDDGSSDDTNARLEAYRQTASFPLRCLRQENSGAARARNYGIRELRAPLCLTIGDDIFPCAEFVWTHLEFHRAHPEPEAAALGFTQWSEQGQVVTPYMRWLESNGIQFAYGDLERGMKPDWRHFWTSNLSLKTAYLRQHPFHEGFQKYGMEDIELGYRLWARHDLRLSYVPRAVAEHLHPTTFLRSCSRAVYGGAAAYLFGELWPEQRWPVPQARWKRTLLSWLSEERVMLPLLRSITDLLTRVWCPNPLLGPVLMLHERLGYRQERQRKVVSSRRHQSQIT